MKVEVRSHLIYVDGKRVPYKETPNKGGVLKPEVIVLHDTAGDIKGDGSVAWLCNPSAKASAHVVVKRDGTIVQLAPCNVKTWHAGASNYKGRANVNGFGFGIEIANPANAVKKAADGSFSAFGQKIPKGSDVQWAETKVHGKGWWLNYSADQVEAVNGLCVAIREAYGVKAVTTHWEISPGRKIDTGPLWDMARTRALVTGNQDDDGKPNQAKTNVAGLNLRGNPGVTSSVISELPRGTSVTIKGVEHVGETEWLQVDVPTLFKSGWVAARYVDL